MQQSIKTRQTKLKQNLCYTVTSLETKKKHFNTFVITQLEFGENVRSVLHLFQLKSIKTK